MKLAQVLLLIAVLGFNTSLAQQPGTLKPLVDTLTPLREGAPPSNFSEMWAGFDPRAESLQIETLHEWEEEGVVLRIVRFHIGVFKGTPTKLAAVYGYPKGGTELPGLLQIHGGGQYADYKACLMNAKRGYATVSIAWAGRISAPNYRVTPNEVKLFWDQETDHPNYRLTTDWGVLDGYHAPGRNPRNAFPSAKAAAWTLDSVESPRNSGWFLCALAARRALTFLERQPEVDDDRLGVYGHSMGGKLTVMTAVDSRVKAAAPSCGGISDRDNDSPLFCSTLGDDVSLKQISCPIFFLSPANDFHGRIGDLPDAVDEITSKDWRVTCSPQHSHQDTPKYEVATLLWFDQHLKGTFTVPQTPSSKLELDSDDGVPVLIVQPDSSKPVQSVEVFYTQHGLPNETPKDREITTHRFWRHAEARESNGSWTAKLPIASTDKPLWAYANVVYALDAPVAGAGYYYGVYEANEFNLSSLLAIATPEELAAANVRVVPNSTRMIEDFADGWEREWFTYKPEKWGRTTHKLYDQAYRAPPNSQMAMEVRCDEANELVVLIDEHAAVVKLEGGNQWKEVTLDPQDFKTLAGEPLPNWESAKRLTLSEAERLRPARGEKGEPKVLGKNWRGPNPEFRNLRWQPRAKLGSADPSSVLDVFPASVTGTQEKELGVTEFSQDYRPSQSLWDQRLDESQVFLAQIKHVQSDDDSFELRIGKGGQIYSLRGPFGESVPPSWRADGSHVSPWNDEVWQFVAVCTKYNGLEATQKVGKIPDGLADQIKQRGYRDLFFVHNSGVYLPGETKLKSLYCPLLASQWHEQQSCFRMLNWGLVPQIKTLHRSPLLYYTQVRDAGDGVIELTWVVHNFSDREDIVFDHLNAPWGGTRISSLPLRYISSPEGQLLEREGFLNAHGAVDVRKTGGWNISCASDADDSPSLALVYGRDRHLAAEQERKAAGEPYCQFTHSLYRDWRANEPLYKNSWSDWQTRPANSFRNYDVCEIIPKLRIVPGTSIWFRSYLVSGRKDKVMQQATQLVNQVDYGLLEFNTSTTPMSVIEQETKTGTKVKFKVFTRPVAGTKPLFAIRDLRTQRQVMTTDPYHFVQKEKLSFELPAEHPHRDYYASAYGYSLEHHHSDWQSLVGYAYESQPASAAWQRLSEVLGSDLFPATTDHHLEVWVKRIAVEGTES
ncbi:MAG: dienelactone hydrolase family protein [Rubripirellula sp.]